MCACVNVWAPHACRYLGGQKVLRFPGTRAAEISEPLDKGWE